MLETKCAFAGRAVMVLLLLFVVQQGCARKEAVNSFIADGVRFHVTVPATASGSKSPVEVGTTEGPGGLRLRINGRDYGPVRSGDSVDVDLRAVEPKVTVNGATRGTGPDTVQTPPATRPVK